MTDSQFTIIGVGSPVVDSLAQVEEDFLSQIEGAKGGMELVDASKMKEMLGLIPSPTTEAPGGSAGNTIFGLTNLGLSSTFLGKLGNCEGGTFYQDRYQSLGGNTSRFKIGNVPNARCLSLITPDSERTMRTDLGAAMTLQPDEISAADFEGCRHAHIEGYMLFNRDLMFKVLDSAQKAGCSISLDLASFEVVHAAKEILPDVLKNYVDVVFANEDEASAFFEKENFKNDYRKMAEAFAEYCNIAAVKIGKEGSFISQGNQVIEVQPIVIEQAIDTTGAGDLWAAGFLYGWLTEKSLSDCGKFGSILGAEVVQVTGAEIAESRWNHIRQQLT